MGILKAAGVAALSLQSLAAGSGVARRQDALSAKYCDPTQQSVCYAQFSSPGSGTTWRIAIPEVAKAPFDTLVQIVAPTSVAWAALAWGGKMAENPLTVAWMSDNTGVVSSRWAGGHTPPTAYAGATTTVLSASKNASHWQVNFLCTGCSTWSSSALDPNSVNKLAWATSNRAVSTPSSNTSTISIHNEKGAISQDLSIGKVDSNSFRRFVLFLSSNPAPGTPSQAPAPPGPPAQAPADPPPATSRGRIPTTIIRASPTAEGPGPTAAPPVATRTNPAPSSTPAPTTIGRPSSPTVRTSVTTVAPPPRPTTMRTTGRVTTGVTNVPGRPATVTVTVTAQQPGRTTTARATTTSCFRREGRPFRVCTSVPGTGGDDDDDDDDSGYGNWWGRI